MSKQTFWDELTKPRDKYPDTVAVAMKSFIHFDLVVSPGTRKEVYPNWTQANKAFKEYLQCVEKLKNKILGYVEDVGGFEKKSVDKRDILFLFIRPDDEAFQEETIAPADEALVGTFTRVNQHYTYTAQITEADYSDDENDGNDEEDNVLLGIGESRGDLGDE